MKKLLYILIILLLYSCSSMEFLRQNNAQLLADDINSSIEDFTSVYYRYPCRISEFYEFVVSDYYLEDYKCNKKRNVIKYIKRHKNHIYIYSTDNFMLFYGKRKNIVIDRTLGLCDWLKTDNYSISSKINSSNFFSNDENIILTGKQEFENNIKIMSSKYNNSSFSIINGDTIVNRAIFQFDISNGLIPICQISDLSYNKQFINDLTNYLFYFSHKYPAVKKILFFTILKK